MLSSNDSSNADTRGLFGAAINFVYKQTYSRIWPELARNSLADASVYDIETGHAPSTLAIAIAAPVAESATSNLPDFTLPSELIQLSSQLTNATTTSPISVRESMADYVALIFSQDNYKELIAASMLTLVGTGFNFLIPYLSSIVAVAAYSFTNTDTKQSVPTSTSDTNLLWNVSYLVIAYLASQIIINRRNLLLAQVSARSTGEILEKVTVAEISKKHEFFYSRTNAQRNDLINATFSVVEIGTPTLTKLLPTAIEVMAATAALTYQFGLPLGAGLVTMFHVYVAYCAYTKQPIIDANQNLQDARTQAWIIAGKSTERFAQMSDFGQYAHTIEGIKHTIAEATLAEIQSANTMENIGLGQTIIPRIAMLAAMLYVGARVQASQVTGAEFVGLLGFLNQLATSLPSLADALVKILAAYPKMEKVFNFLRNKEGDAVDLYPNIPLTVTKGKIEFNNVVFGYVKDAPPRLKGVSLTIEPHGTEGTTVALVSESGEGKTTFYKLLRRYYEAQQGKIFIDGQDIGHVGLQYLPMNISLVSQGPQFSNASIRDNIMYGTNQAKNDLRIFELGKQLGIVAPICQMVTGGKPVSDADLIKIFVNQYKHIIASGEKNIPNELKAKIAELKERVDAEINKRIFDLAVKLGLVESICKLVTDNESITKENVTKKFIKGLDREIGGGGIGLSGGQLQKVAIMRGLIDLKRILLLDEITTGLDSNSAQAVLKGIDAMVKEMGCTVMVITHNLKEIKDFDEIFVIKDGVVQTHGTHKELLAENGSQLYQNLWNKSQNEKGDMEESINTLDCTKDEYQRLWEQHENIPKQKAKTSPDTDVNLSALYRSREDSGLLQSKQKVAERSISTTSSISVDKSDNKKLK